MKAWLIHWPGVGYGVELADTRSKARYRAYLNITDSYGRDATILMRLRATRLPALDDVPHTSEARMIFHRDYDPDTGKQRPKAEGVR